jgi:hypothetical protein
MTNRKISVDIYPHTMNGPQRSCVVEALPMTTVLATIVVALKERGRDVPYRELPSMPEEAEMEVPALLKAHAAIWEAYK